MAGGRIEPSVTHYSLGVTKGQNSVEIPSDYGTVVLNGIAANNDGLWYQLHVRVNGLSEDELRWVHCRIDVSIMQRYETKRPKIHIQYIGSFGMAVTKVWHCAIVSPSDLHDKRVPIHAAHCYFHHIITEVVHVKLLWTGWQKKSTESVNLAQYSLSSF